MADTTSNLNSGATKSQTRGSAARKDTTAIADDNSRSVDSRADSLDNGSSDTSSSNSAGAGQVPFALDDAMGQMKGYLDAANDFVQKRPLVVLSAACAIGMAAAFFLTAREDSDATVVGEE